MHTIVEECLPHLMVYLGDKAIRWTEISRSSTGHFGRVLRNICVWPRRRRVFIFHFVNSKLPWSVWVRLEKAEKVVLTVNNHNFCHRKCLFFVNLGILIMLLIYRQLTLFCRHYKIYQSSPSRFLSTTAPIISQSVCWIPYHHTMTTPLCTSLLPSPY